MLYETKRQRIHRLQVQLDGEFDRGGFQSLYRELGEHFAPRRTRFYEEDRNKGDKRHGKIINEHGMLAARTLRSGMFAGISSPARPWRRLTTPDPDLAEFGKIKDWLYLVNKRMRTMDLRSNLYQALPITYGDMGVFAGSAMGVFPDDDDLMRCYTYPVGSYRIARNHQGRADTFFRKYQMTVRQLVMEFGNPRLSEADKWKPFSIRVKTAFERGDYEQMISVGHMITLNLQFDPRRLDAKYSKPYSSDHYELGASGTAQGSTPYADTFLKESGYDYFPILAPVWESSTEDVYGTSCPGMDALGSTKELQLTEKRVSRAIEKQLNPALQGPTSLRNQKASLIAGDITYVDEVSGKGGLRPIHEVQLAVDQVQARIERIEYRISRCFYEDLFLMLAQMEGIQPRNEAEIAERHEEKLLALGPVLESANDGLLDPLTDIEFARMMEIGWIPEPPEEISGMQLKVEYESIMAKAQKLVGVAGTERFLSFVGNLAAAFPVVLKKVDPLEAVEEYGDMMGVSSKIVRTKEETDRLIAEEQQAMQQKAMMEAAPQLAGAAQQLSATDLSTDNALTRMMAGA